MKQLYFYMIDVIMLFYISLPSWPNINMLYNGYQVIPGGKSGQGVALTTHPHLTLRLKKD
jgi:hypothetical protein